MATSNKILTVSYGTFSCTAEGYEDPLAVVKETTDFFRSVAKDDRFFGAEPPQFDPEQAAEMLHERLAAEGNQGKLTIGQAGIAAASAGALATAASLAGKGEADEPTREPEPDKADLDAPNTETLADDAQAVQLPDDNTIESTAVLSKRDDAQGELDTSDPQTETAAAVSEEGAPAPRPSISADVANKLDRIRAVVTDERKDDASEEADSETTKASVEEDAEGDVAEAVELTSPETADALLIDDALETPEDKAALDDAEDTLADEGASADQVEEISEDAPVGDVITTDEISSNEEENESSAEKTPTIDSPSVDEPDQADLATETHDQSEDDDITDKELDDVTEAARPDAAPELPDMPEAIQNDALPEQPADSTAPQSQVAQPASQSDTPEANAALSEEPQSEDAAKPESAAQPEPTEITAPRARVLKVKRTELMRAVNEGKIARPKREPSTLTPQEEDELARELAAVTAELTGSPLLDDTPIKSDETPGAQPQPLQDAAPNVPLRLGSPIANEVMGLPAIDDSPEPSPTVTRSKLANLEHEEPDAQRLLQQTEAEMGEPEGNRRRSAIAHLRAAVAAKQAESPEPSQAGDDREQGPYREVLANVVRPRRPHNMAEAQAAQPARPSVSPLQLVPEHRVAATSAPTPLPQQKPAAQQRLQTSTMPAANFATYAEQVGASALPDILEAAAAYMTYVEKREHFSRPQLMSVVRQSEQSESSREDRLRSFGQLLREGKIKKTVGGHFSASENIRFQPNVAAG